MSSKIHISFQPRLYDDQALSDEIRETKEKVLNWLKEEALSPKEVSDANAYFNFGITVAGQPLHVVQHVRKLDSIFAGANLLLTPARISLLKNNMDAKRRQEFFWDLRLALLNNNRLGDFQIKPNPPDDVREVFIASRNIFYDSLTKHKLIHAIGDVFRAVMMVIWMLERYAGAVTPKEKKKSTYVA